MNRIQAVVAITRKLREFGYKDLSEPFVEGRVSLILDLGERDPERLGIIGMFALDMLKTAGLLHVQRGD